MVSLMAILLLIHGVTNPRFCESFHSPSNEARARSHGRLSTAQKNIPISNGDGADDEREISTMLRIFFDISVAEEPIGRLVFQIPNNPALLPLHTDNLVKLCTQERKSIDPRCSYIGCSFQYSPQFIEGYPQYRWAHILKGKGRNAVGRPDEAITDPERLRNCTHSVYGGVYYGLAYDDIPGNDKEAVLLTVPLSGPSRGSTGLAIVRVSESPQEWKERLLSNSAVLGWMESTSMNVLLTMARQTLGPPMITGSGII